jgi:hypothetical protein
MNNKRTLLFVVGIVLLIIFGLVMGGMTANLIRSNRSDVAPSSWVSTPVDFFSQEFSSSTDVVPVSGPAVGGLGDALLKSNIWNTLLEHERKQNCADVTSKAISVAQINEAGEFWVENWTVNACGQTEVFKIKFSPGNPDGTEYVITKN